MRRRWMLAVATLIAATSIATYAFARPGSSLGTASECSEMRQEHSGD